MLEVSIGPGGRFYRCLVNKDCLVLFSGVEFAGLGRLIFRSGLSLNPSESLVRDSHGKAVSSWVNIHNSVVTSSNCQEYLKAASATTPGTIPSLDLKTWINQVQLNLAFSCTQLVFPSRQT